MGRKLTKKELNWIIKMGDCLDDKPSTIELFADGHINIVDTKELDRNRRNPKAPFQPLFRFDHVYCDGGDPWT